jgi:hypothetical protein
MSGDGVVVAQVAGGAAVDAAANASEASTSVDNTVTFAFDVEPEPLTITAPDDVVVPAEPGESGADVDFPAPTVSGGVPPVDVECDHASGDFYPIGVTTVTCSATDSAPVVSFAMIADSVTITVTESEETPPGAEPGAAPGSNPGSGAPAGSGSDRRIASTGVDPQGWPAIAVLMMLAGAFAARSTRRRAGG